MAKRLEGLMMAGHCSPLSARSSRSLHTCSYQYI